jgi:uncharacterized lipoprotein YajG
MRVFLTLLTGAVLLGGCAAKHAAGGATANAEKPISDGITSESSSSLSASENYERAIANYSDCVLDHTGNLNACEKQRSVMNQLGKMSSRSSLSQSYTLGSTQITQTNNTNGISQGAHTASTPQAPSQMPPRTSPPIPEAADPQLPGASTSITMPF